jgi:hypothetical protein
MQTRWKGAVVATFAGLVGAVALWVSLAEEVAPPPPAPGAPEAMKGAKAVPVDPASLQIHGDEIAGRQRLLAGARPIQGSRGKLDPRSREAIRPPMVLPDRRLPPNVYRLDQGGVAAAVDARRADLDGCYETAKFHSPDLEGKMTLVLQLEPGAGGDGSAGGASPFASVSSVETDSQLDATMFEGCVETVFQEMKFDAKESTTVRYPMSFEDP